MLNKYGIRAYGIDINEKLLRLAPDDGRKNKLVVADARRIPFRNQSIKLITLTFALHDKDLKLRGIILKECMRVLHCEGRMLITEIELPSDVLSGVGFFITLLHEALSGHFFRGMKFLKSRYLEQFIEIGGLQEIRRYSFRVPPVSIIEMRPRQLFQDK